MSFHIFCARCTIFFRKILNPNISKIDRGPEFTTDNYLFVAKRFNIMYRLTGAMYIHPMTKRRFAFLLRPSNARPSPTSHTLSFFPSHPPTSSVESLSVLSSTMAKIALWYHGLWLFRRRFLLSICLDSHLGITLATSSAYKATLLSLTLPVQSPLSRPTSKSSNLQLTHRYMRIDPLQCSYLWIPFLNDNSRVNDVSHTCAVLLYPFLFILLKSSPQNSGDVYPDASQTSRYTPER